MLGEPSDLDQFLFGAERAPLDKYLPILREEQEARCLYCEREVALGSAHIDHFIPWSRYPIDLGHNFVLAHAACNESKAEHLAAPVHLRDGSNGIKWRLSACESESIWDSLSITLKTVCTHHLALCP